MWILRNFTKPLDNYNIVLCKHWPTKCLPMWRKNFLTSDTRSNECVFNLIDAFVLFCKIVCFKIVTQWWLLYPHFWLILFIVYVLLTHRCKYNGIWWDCRKSERLSAIKPGLIHHIFVWKYLYQVRNMTVVVHSFDVFCHLILTCD